MIRARKNEPSQMMLTDSDCVCRQSGNYGFLAAKSLHAGTTFYFISLNSHHLRMPTTQELKGYVFFSDGTVSLSFSEGDLCDRDTGYCP